MFLQAYVDALAGDPVSAFGGVLITNKKKLILMQQKKWINPFV